MADTNTYTSKQNIKKYTTQAKFDAIDKSDVPVGTEYNIVGSIAESDLDSDLQAKVNLTGDGLTTEVTGGKVKVKNPMTYNQDFSMNVAWDGTASGTQYQFPVATPVYEGSTLGKAIVPVLGSKTVNGTTYHGLFLQNSYTENNYGSNAYSLITATNNFNCAGMIYILPYSNSSAPSTYLLGTDSLIADAGVVITNASGGRLRIGVGASGSSLMPMPKTYSPYQMLIVPSYNKTGAQWVDIREGKIRANYVEYNPNGHNAFDNSVSDGTIYQAVKVPEDGGSGFTRFVLLAPTAPSGTGSTTLIIPNKGGTLATLDDITGGGGGIITTELNETPASPKTITVAELKALDTGFYNATNCILKGDTDTPRGNYHLIKIKKGDVGAVIAQDQNVGNTFVLSLNLAGTGSVGWSLLVTQAELPTFKTLFGDQSIEGTGNIDLYKHTVSITGEAESSTLGIINIDGNIIFYSSKNLECNSLTDLKTVLGDTFIEKAFGYATKLDTNDIFTIDYVNETYVYFSGTTSAGQNDKATVPFTMTLVDDVKTI